MAKLLIAAPKKLYRYRSVSDEHSFKQETQAISNHYVWCTRFDDLNDPMEGTYRLLQNEQATEGELAISRQLYDRKAALGICSFSETNNNAMMWAHYANNFQGICVEYDFDALTSSLGDDVTFARIGYTETANELSVEQANDIDAAKTLLSTKGHQWLYEREWRLISPEQGPLHIGECCATAIFLGRRISKKTRWWLRSTFENLPLWTMSFDGYSIQFQRDAN